MHELKKQPFSANQKVFFCRKLYASPSKASRFRNQNTAYLNHFLLSSKTAFLCAKSLLFAQTFPYSHPKLLFSTPPPPIPTALNLLFAKNTAVLLLFALILCCKAGASHRFKSLPAIPGEVAAFRKTGYLMITGHFRKNTVSTGDLNRPRSPEVRKPLVCFLVLFAQCKKNVKTFPFREAPRFCKPRFSPPQ